PLPSIHLRRESDAARHGFSLAETLSGLNLGDSSPVPCHHALAPKEAVLIEYPSVEPSPASRPETQQRYSPVAVEFGDSATANKPPPPPIPPRPLKHAAANSVSSVASLPASPSPCLPPKPQGYHSEVDLYRDGDNVASGDDGLLFMPQCFIDASHFSLTEGGVRMRPVQLPEGIIEEFIDIAAYNTQANIETCGVLCGRQVAGQEALVMTTLIIPKQSATSDTCTTEREEELFVEQMARDLITLGWIHTHPSQTCFMSSLDLHTQCSYQLMLPEAIAIVCSPKHHPRFGIFRLTDPAGIDVIQNCKQKSAFHPHDESKTIYTDADTGGHVVVANYDFDIIDLLGQHVTVELKNDLAIQGVLESVDQFLNFKLKDIKVVDEERYPHMLSVKNCFVRGSVVRYVQLSPPTVDTALLQDAARREAQSTQQMQQAKPNVAPVA
ncbi:hypothetical protein GGI06_004702, partial [Coemansia sp. S85]